jgi:hypothetical protein
MKHARGVRTERQEIMVKEMIDGTFRQTNLPNESAEYLAKRAARRCRLHDGSNKFADTPIWFKRRGREMKKPGATPQVGAARSD